MKYALTFSEGAQYDILESIQWYNDEKEKLGFEFYERVDEKLSLLSISPLHYSTRFKNIRAAKVTQFPFLIYFKINEKNSSIVILGILHTSRNPQAIKKRK